jgi:mevalonate kinase
VIPAQTPDSAGLQASAAAAKSTADALVNQAANSGQKELKAKHE